jgi:hypothetical protein
MLDAGHIDLDKIKQIVAQWQYDGDTPYKGWVAEYESLFQQAPPKG